jgi:hypothetical protein
VVDAAGKIANDATWALIGANAAPTPPTIDGPAKAKTGTPVTYSFVSSDPDGDNVSYYIDWGDNTSSSWIGPYPSGIVQNLSHTWTTRGPYTIRCKAMDTNGVESDWGELSVRMPRSWQPSYLPFLHWLLDHYPHLFPFLHAFAHR